MRKGRATGSKKGFFTRVGLFFQRAHDFITRGVWESDRSDYPGRRWSLIHLLRVVLLATRRSMENRVQLRASGLTFYTLMSLVPFVALLFGIAKGFGLEAELSNFIYEKLTIYPQVAEVVVNLAGSLFSRTKGGLITGVGVAVLFWSVIKMFNHIENSFNAIWELEKSRSWVRKFSDYLAVIVVAPLLIVIISGANVMLQELVRRWGEEQEYIGAITPALLFLLRMTPYVLVSVILGLLYIVVPNTRIKIGPGLLSGLIAGVCFVAVQYFYMTFQVGVSRYNAIYGSFAAIPLFLIWMKLSWLIILLGAELSYAIQNVHIYEYESEDQLLQPRQIKELTLLLFLGVAERFNAGERAPTSIEIAEQYGIPLRLTRRILHWMHEMGLLSMVETGKRDTKAYQPARSLDSFTPRLIFDLCDEHGKTFKTDNRTLALISTIYSGYREKAQSAEFPILELSTPEEESSGEKDK